MSDSFNITRNDLTKISTDLRVIRAFERLFRAIPADLTTSTTESSNSNAKSNQAIGQTIENERITKGNRVLT